MDQDPFRTLFIAIHTSNIEQMKEAIRSGVNINQKNSTPLMAACYEGNRNIVSFLLQNGADPSEVNNEGKRAIDFCKTVPVSILVFNSYQTKQEDKMKEKDSKILQLMNEIENLQKLTRNTSMEFSTASNLSQSKSSVIFQSFLRDLDYNDIEKGKVIGSGGFATVYGGKFRRGNLLIALKMEHTQIKGAFKREIDILKRLHHPNIIKSFGTFTDGTNEGIVLEYLGRATLNYQLHKRNIFLDLWRQVKIASDIMKGVNYLHQSNPKLIHRDLKSENILLDAEWNAKLNDFGLAKEKIATLQGSGIMGTVNWMAPEIMAKKPMNEKVDIYSFGMILFEMASNSIPFEELGAMQIVTQLVQEKRPVIPNNCNSKLKEIITKCWQQDHSLRPTSIWILGQLELIAFDPEFQEVNKACVSSQWDFSPDFLSYDELQISQSKDQRNEDLGWKSKLEYENFQFFKINVNLLTSLANDYIYDLQYEYCLNNPIEYSEWSLVERILTKKYYETNKLRINDLFAIQNDIANSKFKKFVIQYQPKTLQINSQDKISSLLSKHYSTLAKQFPHQHLITNEIKDDFTVIPLFYFLKNEQLGWKTCSTGFTSEHMMDGWLGKGFYFSSNLEYLDQRNKELEPDSNGDYSVLLCYVVIGEVFPFSNIKQTPNSDIGSSCHFSLVAKGSSFSSFSQTICKEELTFDHITHFAIFNLDHILPKYLLKVKKL